jgi:hypothetical protein
MAHCTALAAIVYASNLASARARDELAALMLHASYDRQYPGLTGATPGWQ